MGFASTTTAVCTVSGSTVTVVAVGACTIQALQAGNANYLAAPTVNQSFTVAKASQTIAFAALSGKTYGNPPFAVSATASSLKPIPLSAPWIDEEEGARVQQALRHEHVGLVRERRRRDVGQCLIVGFKRPIRGNRRAHSRDTRLELPAAFVDVDEIDDGGRGRLAKRGLSP